MRRGSSGLKGVGALHSATMRHLRVLWLGGVLLCGGCAFKGQSTEETRPEVESAWRPRPVAIRVYPSTRFTTVEGQPVLEAKVELADEMGDPIKAPGEFRLELLRHSDPLRLAPPRQIYTWRVPVYTLTDQRTFYDPITRSYLMRLRLHDPELAANAPLLRVAFTPIDGARLEAESPIRTDW